MVMISGFSDEISDVFEEQLRVVKSLGMEYISIRGVNGTNFSDFSEEDVNGYVLPTLKEYGVKVSSIGSPIGKIYIGDQDAYTHQLQTLEKLCHFAKLLNCRYIRIFSFYIPEGSNPLGFEKEVFDKLLSFVEIAAQHDITLLHENEKDIYGDTAARCKNLFDKVESEHFKAIFDFANFVQVGQNPTEAYDMLKPYVEYIHVKDARFEASFNVLCGTGDGNIEALLAKFLQEKYQGFLTLEPHLAMFGMLAHLELDEAEKVIGNSTLSGSEAYEQSYHALCEILQRLGSPVGENK